MEYHNIGSVELFKRKISIVITDERHLFVKIGGKPNDIILTEKEYNWMTQLLSCPLNISNIYQQSSDATFTNYLELKYLRDGSAKIVQNFAGDIRTSNINSLEIKYITENYSSMDKIIDFLETRLINY